MCLGKNLKWIAVIFLMAISPYAFAQDQEASMPYGHNAKAGKYAHINGIKFYYETYGTGDPLVLIHGNGDNIAGMAAQIDYFSGKYRVIVADSRGHGNSGMGEGPLNYAQMMEDWNSLLNQLKITNANIFGWSDGGIIGLLLAIKHPDKVGKLAIMGANLRPDGTAIQAWVKPLLNRAVKHVDDMSAKQDTSENWATQRQLLNLLITQPHIDVTSLHQIKAPVLVMAGDRDVIKLEHTVEIFQNIKKSNLAILPGNTHFAPANTPDKLNNLLNDFFTKPFTMPTTEAIMEPH